MTVYMILIHGSLTSKPYIWPLQDIANWEYNIYLYGYYEAGRKVDRGGVIVFVGWGERGKLPDIT
jgi:hypothetical protein